MAMPLTDDIVRSLSTPQSFERGMDLFHSGALFDLARQGNRLLGKCEGSSAPVYLLQAEIDAGGVRMAECSCPYDQEGLCKHLVALLLAAIHSPEDFNERQPIKVLLEGLDREALIALLEKLVVSNPGLYDLIQTAASTEKVLKDNSNQWREKRKTQVSETAYRRQVKNILHSLSGYRMSEAYWMMGGMVKQLSLVEETAFQFLEAGDVEGAITILMALLEETWDAYEQFDDSDGYLGDFLSELGQPLAEAFLSADLSEEERVALKKRLKHVVDEMESYGIEGTVTALAALEEGWEGLSVAYDGDEDDESDVEEGYWAANLTEMKLNVLERQGRLDEYLELCQAAGEYRRYALKLLEIGRKEEALAVALKQLSSAEDTLAIAQKLREAGELQGAIRVGERGLSFSGNKHALGTWLGPLEEAQRRPGEAMQAYRAAFDSMPSIELYKTLQRLSGQGWERLKPELMAYLQRSAFVDVLIDVYLKEQDWNAAIVVSDQHQGDYRLLEKVVEAVLPYRPEWVIRVSIRQSDELIEKKQSKYYEVAVRWLQRAKMAYLQMGKGAEWHSYLAGLKDQYSRRPALQEQLRKL